MRAHTLLADHTSTASLQGGGRWHVLVEGHANLYTAAAAAAAWQRGKGAAQQAHSSSGTLSETVPPEHSE